MTGQGASTGWALARTVAAYTLGRLAVFIGVALLLAAAGLRGLLLAMVALVVSALVSGLLLRGQRASLVEALSARRGESLARRAREQQVRDHVQEVRRQQSPPSGGPPADS